MPLEPQEEARLIAAAKAKGLPADALVREVVDRILADALVVSAGQDEGPQRDRQPVWELIVEEKGKNLLDKSRTPLHRCVEILWGT